MDRNLIVDVDGVIAQYNFPRMMKKWFGVSVKNEDIWCYSLEDALGLDPFLVEEMWVAEADEPAIFIPGAIKSLEELRLAGYKILIRSQRAKIMGAERLEGWLEENKIPFDQVLATPLDMPDYAHAAIDDRPSKLSLLNELVKVKTLILFDQPWNRQCLNIHGRFYRVKTWAQVKSVLKRT